MSSDNFIKIDQNGYFILDNQRIEDEVLAKVLLTNLKTDENGRYTTTSQGQTALVEFYDAPIVAHKLKPIQGERWSLQGPYGFDFEFSLGALSVDEWDRFYGETKEGLQFILTDQAQNSLFDQMDEFADDSITYSGVEYMVGPYSEDRRNVGESSFWDQKYIEGSPGWELNEPSAPLQGVIAQLKLPKSRIIVLGCGSGNDAAFLAEQGHIVTAVDFSTKAINVAKQKYSDIPNLTFFQADIFDLPAEFTGAFDIVFEHTCYVAVSPEKRNELIKIWKNLLQDDGHFLGVFFLSPHRFHPPFTSSEWEINKRLSKSFDHLYWTRWQKSIEPRMGRELIVYSKKK